MLVSFLGLATGDDRTDAAVVRAGTGDAAIGGADTPDEAADEEDAALDVLAAEVLVDDFDDPAGPPNFPFPPVSNRNGTITFVGGGLMFS